MGEILCDLLYRGKKIFLEEDLFPSQVGVREGNLNLDLHGVFLPLGLLTRSCSRHLCEEFLSSSQPQIHLQTFSSFPTELKSSVSCKAQPASWTSGIFKTEFIFVLYFYFFLIFNFYFYFSLFLTILCFQPNPKIPSDNIFIHSPPVNPSELLTMSTENLLDGLLDSRALGKLTDPWLFLQIKSEFWFYLRFHNYFEFFSQKTSIISLYFQVDWDMGFTELAPAQHLLTFPRVMTENMQKNLTQ